MPILNSSTAPQLAAASIKGYRELLRKLKREQASEGTAAEPATLLQQAKERVLLYRQRKQAKEPLDPRGALLRVTDRLLQAKQDLSQIRSEKGGLLRATYAAVRGDAVVQGAAARGDDSTTAFTTAAAGTSSEELAVLGSDGAFRAIVMAGLGAASKIFMTTLCSTHVEGAHIVREALQRPAGQALITVSNHVAALDDPLVTAALLPPGAFLSPTALRWTLCATDRCFTSPAATAFFRAAKVLPVERGAGLVQAGMAAAEGRLRAGDWVHVFPEGTRSADGRAMRPARRGVGRLVAACTRPPLVVPFVHSGMERVMPRGAALPHPGSQIRILVGEPVQVADLLEAATRQNWPDARLYFEIAERIGTALHALKARLDCVALSEVVMEQPAWGAAEGAQADMLVPLLDAEMDVLTHPLGAPSTRQVSGLAPISSRAAQGFGRVRQRLAMAAATFPTQVEAGRMDMCTALLRGSVQGGDAAVGRAAQAALDYVAQRVSTARQMMLSAQCT